MNHSYLFPREKPLVDKKFSEFINKYGPIELVHISGTSTFNLKSRRANLLGGAVIKLALQYKVVAKNNYIDDKNLNLVFNALNNYLKDLVIANFPLTQSFLTIKVGNGFSEEEFKSDSFILEAFNLYITKIVEIYTLKVVLDDICFLFPQQVSLANAQDYKTALQEFLQSKKIPLPKYLTDNGQQITATSYRFTTHVNITDLNLKIVGVGSSKKLSQLDTAQKACDKLNISKNKSLNIITLSNKSFYFVNNHKDLNQKQVNHHFHKIFGFDHKYNILPAFVHLRMKSHGLISHKRFSILGSTVLQLFKIIVLYTGDTSDNDELSRLTAIHSSDFFLTQVKSSNFFRIDAFPYYKKGGEYQNDAYNTECIQALFGLSFIYQIEKNQSKKLFDLSKSTQAYKWFNQLLENPDLELNNSNVYLIHNLVKRLHSLGINLAIKKNDNFYFLLSCIYNEDKQYIVDLNLNISEYNKEQATKKLSEFIIKTLNRLDGSNLSQPKNNQYAKLICGLSSFIVRALKKNFEPSTQLIKYIDKKNKYANTLTSECLLEVADETSNDVDKFVYLFNILYKENLIDKEISCLEFIKFNNQNVNFISNFQGLNDKDLVLETIRQDSQLIEDEQKDTIINISKALPQKNNLDSIGNITILKDKPITVENYFEETNPEFSIEKTLILDDKSSETNSSRDLRYQVIYDSNIDNTPSTIHPPLVPNDFPLLERIKYFNTLSQNELRKIWELREEILDFSEDAAIILSLIRVNEGIDKQIRKYTEIMDFEIITSLDLPSLKNDSSNLEQSFKIHKKDTRIRKQAMLVVRPNQANFRAELIKLWKFCPITGCNILEILDAAHIYPYRGEKDNQISNGILLRTDIHKLFDKYLLSIDPSNFTVHLSKSVTDPQYTQYEGKIINNCKILSLNALEYHWIYFENPDF